MTDVVSDMARRLRRIERSSLRYRQAADGSTVLTNGQGVQVTAVGGGGGSGIDFDPEDYGADPTGVTDSTISIQACIDAAMNADRHATVRFGPGTFLVNGAPRTDRGGRSILSFPGTFGARMAVKFEGAGYAGPPGMRTIIKTTRTTDTYSAIYGPASVIGSATFENSGSDICWTCPITFEGLKIQLDEHSPLGGIDGFGIGGMEVRGCTVVWGDGSGATSLNGTTSAFGFRCSGKYNFGLSIFYGCHAQQATVGIALAEPGHTWIQSCDCYKCEAALAVQDPRDDGSTFGHGMAGGYLMSDRSKYSLAGWHPSTGVASPSVAQHGLGRLTIDIEDASGFENAVFNYAGVLDANNKFVGDVQIMSVSAFGTANNMGAVTGFQNAQVNIENKGVRDLASASTITALPGNDSYKITGTATINTITPSYPGRRIQLIWKTGATAKVTEAGNVKLIGTTVFAGDDDGVLQLICDGTTWFESAPSNIRAKSSFANGTTAITTQVDGNAFASLWNHFLNPGDAFPTFGMFGAGTMFWGPGGSTAADTTLTRGAANVLQTPDRFIAVDGLTTKTKAGTPVDADFQSTPADGTMVVDTTTSKLWLRVGGAWVVTPVGGAAGGDLSGTYPNPSIGVLGTGSTLGIDWGATQGGTSDTNLYRSAAAALKTDATFTAVGGFISAPSAGTVVLGNVSSQAAIQWGSSIFALDTNLYRPAANRLKTDDHLQVMDGIATKTKAGTPVDADFQVTPQDGTVVIDTSTNQLWMRVAAAWVRIGGAAGTTGTPSDTNRYVTEQGPRTNLPMNNWQITALQAGGSQDDATNVGQTLEAVDFARSGFALKRPVYATSITTLPAHTRSGNTLTATANGSLLSTFGAAYSAWVTGSFLQEIALQTPSGASSGELRGVARDGSTLVVVQATGNPAAIGGWVQKYNGSTGAFISEFHNPGVIDIGSPQGITVDSSGNIYLAAQTTANGVGRIYKFNSSGTLQWSQTFGGFLVQPWGIATDGTNVTFVDRGANQVLQVLCSTGASTGLQFGTTGTGNGQFASPTGICLDGSGNIFVCDAGNSRVQKFNSAGTYQSQFGSAGSGNGQFTVAGGGGMDIDIDGSANMWVSDRGRIQKFNSSGTYLDQTGTMGTGPGQLMLAGSLVVDSSNNVWVSQGATGTQKMEKFQGAAVTAAPPADVLVRHEGSGTHLENGIYSVTSLGSVSTTWSMTRRDDADESAELGFGALVHTIKEDNHGGGWFYLSTVGSINLNSTAMTWERKQGGGIDYGLTTTLPIGVTPGDRCAFTDNISSPTYVWDLVYVGESGTYWRCTGGNPLKAESDTGRALTNSTTYGNLPTDPLSVTAPLAGDYDVSIAGDILMSAAGSGLLSFTFSASAAVDADCVSFLGAAALAFSNGATKTRRKVGLAAAQSVAEKARTGGNYTATFSNRRLQIMPIRVS